MARKPSGKPWLHGGERLPKAGEQIVLYSCRHTFRTETAGRVSDIELAELMGHTEVRTTHRYVHLNADRLHEICRRARG